MALTLLIQLTGELVLGLSPSRFATMASPYWELVGMTGAHPSAVVVVLKKTSSLLKLSSLKLGVSRSVSRDTDMDVEPSTSTTSEMSSVRESSRSSAESSPPSLLTRVATVTLVIWNEGVFLRSSTVSSAPVVAPAAPGLTLSLVWAGL